MRLFEAEQQRTRELTESLQQQTATADVLKVISQSTFDLQTVLDALVESATRLCDADHTFFFQRDGEIFRWVAGFGHENDVHARLEDYFRTRSVPVNRGSITGRTALVAKVVHVTDVLADPEYTWSGAQEIGGWRAALGVPLLRKGDVVGVLFIAKTVPQPFTAKQIELATTFADQAVIAIENTRLLNELRESLQQQTATADVLKVISRSVFDIVAESSVNLCEAERATIYSYDGELLRVVTALNAPPELKEWIAQHPIRPGRESGTGRAALERRTVHIPDVQADPEYTFGAKDVEPVRTVLAVPILKGDDLLGVILIYRFEVRPFTSKQIPLSKLSPTSRQSPLRMCGCSKKSSSAPRIWPNPCSNRPRPPMSSKLSAAPLLTCPQCYKRLLNWQPGYARRIRLRSSDGREQASI